MKIIIAPAKKMRATIDYMEAWQKPVFFQEANKIKKQLKTLTLEETKKMLQCSDTIAKHAYCLNQNEEKQGVPALLSYDGIQYTYMAPHIFSDEYYAYVQQHVRILSGYYGILKPMDEVHPYRLELDNHIPREGYQNLYAFWGNRVYQELMKDDHEILDLASKQYSKMISKYRTKTDHYVRCYFMEERHHTRKEKGVYVKMARGEMVRYLTEINAQHIEEAKGFQRMGYQFRSDLSDDATYIFTRKEAKQ